MTVRMLQAFNGLYEGQIVSTLSGAEEVRLVGLGFAAYDLDGPSVSGATTYAAQKLAPTAVFAGDSRVLQAFSDSTTGRSFNAKGFPGWLMQANGNPWRIVQTAGVGGDTIALLAARRNGAAPGALFGSSGGPGWNPYRANYLFIVCAINDILNGVSTASSIASASQIISDARDVGTVVVWPTEPPPGPGTTLTAPQRALLLAWNSALQALTSTYSNLVVPDTWTTMEDPANLGYSYASMHADASAPYIHWNNNGGRAFAQATSTKLAAVGCLPPARTLLLAGDVNDVISYRPFVNQYQVNPTLAGANRGATGAAAATSNCTVSEKMIAHVDGSQYGQMIQSDITFSAAGYYVLAMPESAGNFVGGEAVFAACDVRVGAIDAVDGVLGAMTSANGIINADAQLTITNNDTSTAVATAHSKNTNDVALLSGFSLVECTPSWKIKTGVPSSVRNWVYINAASAGSCRVLTGRPTMRRSEGLVQVA
jgi:hypothetical protein